MLVELAIENYAVVESIRVRFDRGLNWLSGETGSGESIVVDALALLLGGRASAEMVRGGAERARISGIFEVASDGKLSALLDAAGIEMEDQELLIEREILANGKSRAFVGNRPATTAALLRDVAAHLGDIHGQARSAAAFFASGAARNAGCVFRRVLWEEIAALYARWRAGDFAGAWRDWIERRKRSFVWRICGVFRKSEIEAVAPEANEDARLENERRVLRNVVKIEEIANAAYSALYDAPESAAGQLRTVIKRLEELSRLDESIGDTLCNVKAGRDRDRRSRAYAASLFIEARSRSGATGSCRIAPQCTRKIEA